MSSLLRPKVNKEILFRLKNGEELAFDSIYWKYSAWVYNFAYSLLYDKELAEDLTQTVFLKIWERHEDLDPENGFESYLFTIARNLVYKETENRLHNEHLIENIQKHQKTHDSATEEEIDKESLQQYISALVEQLPSARKEIYRLSRQEHLSNKEIAAQLNISEKTVETQLYRSLQFLKKKLSEDSGLLLLLAFLLVK